MLDFLAVRHRQPEWMDEPGADPAELSRSLAFIQRVNGWLGYTRASLHHLKKFSRRWKPGEKITLLDVATGSADIPLAMLRWAEKAGFDLRIIAIELHEKTAHIAAVAAAGNSRLTILRADAAALPFADRSIDYVHTAMFIHHLDEPAILRVLQEMNRVARRGILVADLLRHRRAYLWIRLLTLGSPAMVRHDARISVAQALRQDEVLALRDRAGLNYARYCRHFGHRFILAGEKNL